MTGPRILALHGCGTSADIWRVQSQSFRNLLPSGWEFDFFDGGDICSPADGIQEVYPGPYFCYYDVPAYENIETAHALVHEVLEEEGPFDGIIGFSQGAALAASLILHHQAEQPYSPPLFRFAIFVNGSLPYSKSSEFGVDVSQMWRDLVRDEEGPVYTPTDDDSGDSYMSAAQPEHKACGMLPIRRFSPRTHKTKIEIPTGHVYGRNDEYRTQSLRLLELCDAKQAISFEHVGGHDVPRTQEQSRAIANTILRTYENAQFVSA